MRGSIASAMHVLDGAEGAAQLEVVRVVPAVEQPELRLPAHDEAEVGREAQFHLLAWSLGPHHGTPDRHQDVLGDGVDQLQIEGPLGGEVLVEQWLRHAGGLGDVVHGRGAVAPLREELERHGEELAPPLFRREPPRCCLYRARHRLQVTERSETGNAPQHL